MTRRRYNGLTATLGAGLTSSGTSITFAAALTYKGGTSVPTLAGSDYIPLTILDTDGNVVEIVHLTAYTSGATTGTIVRGREGTAGASHSNGDPVVNAPTVVDFTEGPPPRTPGTQDDEFDGLSAVSWANGPTAPTTWDINSTIPGKGYLRANGSGGSFVSVLQAIPGSYPFTVIARVNSNRRGSGSTLGLGLVLGPATPTTSSKILWMGPNHNGGSELWQRLIYNTWSTGSFNSAGSNSAMNLWSGPAWIKMVATSATSLAFYVSADGDIWSLVETGLNPGFTPGVMGLGMSENGTADLEGAVDFFRVT